MSQDLIIPYLPKPQETRLDKKQTVVDRIAERPVIASDEQQLQKGDYERQVHQQQQQDEQQLHHQQQKQQKQPNPAEQVSEAAPSAMSDSPSDTDSDHIDIFI